MSAQTGNKHKFMSIWSCQSIVTAILHKPICLYSKPRDSIGSIQHVKFNVSIRIH